MTTLPHLICRVGLGHGKANVLYINLLTQGPMLEIYGKNIENWQSWNITFFCFFNLKALNKHFLGFLFFKKILFFPNEYQLGFHMKYHLFLNYEWILQNLKKISFKLTRTRLYVRTITNFTSKRAQKTI